MSGLLTILLLGFLGTTTASGSWGYGKTHGGVYGPSHWGHVSELCDGRAQSPINIVRDDDDDDDDRDDLRPLSVRFTYRVEGSLVNNGHSPTFSLEKGGATLQNQVDGGTYKLAQFHFHFGCDKTVGSEHTVKGKSYAGELHLVFYNAKYKGVGDAAAKTDGLAVIGAFLTESVWRTNGELRKLKSSLDKIKDEGTKVKGIHVRLAQILPGLSSGELSYYTYKGSLTTPTCNESVRWLVLAKPIRVSRATLESFRGLKASHGFKRGKMCNNFRPTQHLNGRRIKFYES